MQGMRFKFHLVDSTSVENQLVHVLVGGKLDLYPKCLILSCNFSHHFTLELGMGCLAVVFADMLMLIAGIHSLLDGAEVHVGAGLTWYVGVELGRVRAPSHVCLQVGPVSIVVEKVPTKVSLYYSVQ